MKKAAMRKYGMMMDMRMIAPTICDAVAVSILRESEFSSEMIQERTSTLKRSPPIKLSTVSISSDLCQKIQVIKTFPNIPLAKRFIMRPKGVVSKKLIGAYMTR
jgi:hypothetical protein